jgi:hypothetical protein
MEVGYCDPTRATYDPVMCKTTHNPWMMLALRAVIQWMLADFIILVARLAEANRLRAIKGSCCYCFLSILARIAALCLPVLMVYVAIRVTIETYDKGFALPRNNTALIARRGAVPGNYSTSQDWGSSSREELVKPERQLDPWALITTIIMGWVIKFGVSTLMYVWIQVRPGGGQEHIQGFGDVQKYFNNTEACMMACGGKDEGQNQDCSERSVCEHASSRNGPSHCDPVPVWGPPHYPQYWNGQYTYPYPPQPHLPPTYYR